MSDRPTSWSLDTRCRAGATARGRMPGAGNFELPGSSRGSDPSSRPGQVRSGSCLADHRIVIPHVADAVEGDAVREPGPLLQGGRGPSWFTVQFDPLSCPQFVEGSPHPASIGTCGAELETSRGGGLTGVPAAACGAREARRLAVAGRTWLPPASGTSTCRRAAYDPTG